jgi:hypothetical protein
MLHIASVPNGFIYDYYEVLMKVSIIKVIIELVKQ